MKKIVVLFLVLVFLASPLQAKAYLTEEWSKECGYVSYNEGAFFLHGLRLYSRANWKEIFDYIGKEACVEGYLERKQGRNIGISYHLISMFEKPEKAISVEKEEEKEKEKEEGKEKKKVVDEFHESITVAPAENKSPGLQAYYGFLTQGNGNRTYLNLDNGQKVLLLRTFWSDDFAGPKFFVEGQAIIRDRIIRSIKEPGVYTYEEYNQLFFSKDR